MNSDQAGLSTHERVIHDSSATVLGVDLDGDQQCTRVTSKRALRLRGAIRAVLTRGRASGKLLEVIVGHATLCALIDRSLLACFHAIFAL